MADIVDVFKCLGKVIRRVHTILAKGGKKALEEELLINSKKTTGNFFTQFELVQKTMTKWDDVLKKMDNLALQLEKGDVSKVIDACKEISRAISDLQCFIASVFVEVGSFVPGPIGIVCSLVLAIGCFAAGNIGGGFLNLLGAIPFAKCAKFFPKADFLRIVAESGLNKYQPKGFNLTWKIPSISQLQYYGSHFSKNFSLIFEKSLGAIKTSTKDTAIIEGFGSCGKKTSISVSNAGTSNALIGKVDDGWNMAREELIGEKIFELGFWNK